ncbi:unnamed protein product, partial [Meganyctiphanes norvegica]
KFPQITPFGDPGTTNIVFFGLGLSGMVLDILNLKNKEKIYFVLILAILADLEDPLNPPYGFSPRLLRLPLQRPVGYTNYNITYLKHGLARYWFFLQGVKILSS